MLKRLVLTGSLALAVGLTAAGLGWGQGSERPWSRLFGGLTGRSAPAKAPAEDPRRLVEIRVELAWLADPATFPYFLEARVEGSALSVRGFVPDRAVRDHALKMARLHSPYPVTDALKEHPSLAVRAGQMSPQQLQGAAVSALREALPRQYTRVQVQCAADGTVTLRGPVNSAEEKLAASRALRRLYGCTSVQNLTQAPGLPDIAQAPAAPKKDPPPTEAPPRTRPALGPPSTAKVEPKKDEPKKDEPKPAPVASTPEPPALPKIVHGPSVDPPAAPKKDEPKKEEPVAAEEKPAVKVPLTAAAVTKLEGKLKDACAGAKDVKVELTAAKKLKVTLTVASDEQISPLAGKVYSVPELNDYRDELELHFTVADAPTEKKK